MSETASKFGIHHVTLIRRLRAQSDFSQPVLADIVIRDKNVDSKAESGQPNLTIDTLDLIRFALLACEQGKLALRMRVAKNILVARTGTHPPMSQEALSITAGCNLTYVSQLELGLMEPFLPY